MGKTECPHRAERKRSAYRLVAILAAAASLATGCDEPIGPTGPTSPDPPPRLTFGTQTIPDIVATVGEAITPVTLPKATLDGRLLQDTSDYSVCCPPILPLPDGSYWSRALPDGLGIRNFVLSGTPTSPQKTTSYVWSAHAQGGGVTDAKLTFNITIYLPITDPIKEPIVSTYRGRGDEVAFLNPDGSSFDRTPYTLQLNNAAADVYLIVTNTNGYETYPRIESLDGSEATSMRDQRRARSVAASVDERRYRHPSSVMKINSNPPRPPAISTSRYAQAVAESREPVSEGDRFTFWTAKCFGGSSEYQDNPDCAEVPATARRVVTDGSISLVVWVADITAYDMTSTEITALVDTFLRPGVGNDVYDWLTAIFGDPWGPYEGYSEEPLGLIPADAASQIHILLYDFRDATGYYSAANNYLRDVFPQSNERLMFYVSSYLSDKAQMSVWVHEFQHMIAFYQKQVRNSFEAIQGHGVVEMSALVAEDLVAEKLGSYYIQTHFDLSRYNCHNYWPSVFGRWSYGKYEDTNTEYAVTYALGAYLARNYGGAPLFGNIVRNDESGTAAIEDALRSQGHTESFEDVLTKWAVANLLSDDPQARHPYRYNAWSTSTAGGLTFRLKPINLYDYRSCDGHSMGPFTFSIAEFSAESKQAPYSNRYVYLGRKTGTIRLFITGDYGTRFTVVVKE